MKTFQFKLTLQGRVTLPDTTVLALRELASEDPTIEGGPVYLNALLKQFYEPEQEDDFLRGALQHALRQVVRQGFLEDIKSFGKGVGVRLAPAEVEVGVPLRVTTKTREGAQQLHAELTTTSTPEGEIVDQQLEVGSDPLV